MTPAQLSRTVLHTVRRAVDEGAFGRGAAGVRLPERVVVESPPRRGAGDYALRVAFQLAKQAGSSPYDVARVLRERVGREAGVERVEIAGGGFLNVTLDRRARGALLAGLAAQDVPPAPDAPGADIARWAAVTGEDPEGLAVRTTRDSSLFRVQYAHARARALLRNARDLGLRPETGAGVDPHPLPALLADHARVAEETAPARQARHLVAVADAFFDFHDACPPLPRGEEKPGAAHRARLAVVEATGAVLAGGLARIGVTAPPHL